MRILAAGWHGQIASAFMQIAPQRKDISAFAIGRPGLDICEPRSVERALGDIRPDVLINLAATPMSTAPKASRNWRLRSIRSERGSWPRPPLEETFLSSIFHRVTCSTGAKPLPMSRQMRRPPRPSTENRSSPGKPRCAAPTRSTSF